jgi:catechol 2,3-dioxygenase-like lactoylglutathione lyase family enzyme
MAVLRIVPNLSTESPNSADRFYREILGLDVVMDQGWILTYAAAGQMKPQINIASGGGSGAPLPDISVEVDNLDEIYTRVKSAALDILYELTEEPWGVRRFIVRDPLGKSVNILEHIQ